MKRVFRFFLWTLLFLALLLGMDQFFLRGPVQSPALTTVRHFYLDFRGRLLSLMTGNKNGSIEALIEEAETRPAPSPLPAVKSPPRPAARLAPKVPSPPAEPPGPRYLYVDRRGDLHFADSWEEVPTAYRKGAQPLQGR